MNEPTLHISVIEPVPHQVFQRNEQDEADLTFKLDLASITGVLEARITSGASNDTESWQSIGLSEGSLFSGTLHNISIGQYQLEFRIVSAGTILAACSVEPVFVGDLWILAGQSNMDGCGKLIDVEQPQVGVSCFYMGDRWGIASDPLCWLNESLDPVNWTAPEADLPQAILAERRDRVQGAGLGISFAKEVRKHMDVPIGLIMCSHGGTSMAQWDSRLSNEGGRSLYGAMLRKVNKLGGKVKGCLWYQGESQSSSELAPLYFEQMKFWVASLRNDVNNPKLPFIYAQLSVFYVLEPDNRWPDSAHWNHIQQQQYALEQTIPLSAVVPTIDAGLADIIHLDTPSLRRLGQRMAWQALRLAYGRHVAETGPRPVSFIWNDDRTELRITLSGINGRLADVEKPLGFRVEHNSRRYGFNASLLAEQQQVLLRFEQSVPEKSQLWHGAGFNPAVNVKDSKGIPLLVFGPVAV